MHIMQGYVYCLISSCKCSPSCTNTCKLGYTQKCPTTRAYSWSQQGHTWVVAYARTVSNPRGAEALLKKFFSDRHQGHELFRGTPEEFKSVFALLEGDWWKPDNPRYKDLVIPPDFGDEDDEADEADEADDEADDEDDDEDDEKYEIERILWRRKKKTPLGPRVDYLIRWVGHKKPTWNARAGIFRDVPQLCRDFDRKFLKWTKSQKI